MLIKHVVYLEEITDFPKFIDHFSELNRGSLSSITVPLPMVQPLTDIHDVINQPFSLDEIKIAINKINNNKASGVDTVLNGFIKYCHVDCLKLLVDYFNIILDTGIVPTEWCFGIIYPLYKKRFTI